MGQAMLLGASSETMRRSAGRRARRTVAVALCLAAAVALTACNSRRNQAVPVASAADLPAAATTVGAPAATQLAAAAPVATAPARAPEAMPEATAGTGDPVAGAGQDEPAGQAEKVIASFETAEPTDPDEVMGLGRKAVQELLGKPGLVRREAPAEVWQYQSRGCVLDVFLYEASADFEVVYLEARTGQAITAATDSCLGAVIDQRNPPTS